MKITRSELRRMISEASDEMWAAGQSDYEEQQALMQSDEFHNDLDYDYEFQMAAEERHAEEQDHMYELAKDVLDKLIGDGISSEELVGKIRQHRDLRFYPFETIMMAIDELDSKGNITGFLGDGMDY